MGTRAERRIAWFHHLAGECAASVASLGEEVYVVSCFADATVLTHISAGTIVAATALSASEVPHDFIQALSDNSLVLSGRQSRGVVPFGSAVSVQPHSVSHALLCTGCGDVGLESDGTDVLFISSRGDAPQPFMISLDGSAPAEVPLPGMWPRVAAIDGRGGIVVGGPAGEPWAAAAEIVRADRNRGIQWRLGAVGSLTITRVEDVAAWSDAGVVAVVRLVGNGSWGASRIDAAQESTYLVTATLDGVPLWAYPLDQSAQTLESVRNVTIASAPDGFIAVSGIGRDCREYWVATFGPDGAPIWTTAMSASQCETLPTALAVAVTPTFVVVAGRVIGQPFSADGDASSRTAMLSFAAAFER